MSSGRKTYNVLYGKPQNKKHKTWDNDGVLILENKVAILKDDMGIQIGRTKFEEELAVDAEIYISGKSVKIVDQIENSESNVITQDTNETKTKILSEENKTNIFSEDKPSSYLAFVKQSKPKLSRNPLAKRPIQNTVVNIGLNENKKRPLEETTLDNVESNQTISTEKRIFNIVYGKPSTKKHKSWENDGILEVYNNSAYLKDSTGKLIDTKHKLNDLLKYESGFETYIGGKCVQIVQENTSTKTSKENELIKPKSIPWMPPKKVEEGIAVEDKNNSEIKTSLGSTNHKTDIDLHKVPWKPLTKRMKHLNNPIVVPLIMPKPIVDHQWKYNLQGHPTVDVQVESFLTRVLKPHQREGVSFLYQTLCDLNNVGFEGAILADEMGLGKTLQCITLLWTLLRQGPYGNPVIKRVLIVTPSSLTRNWNEEFKKWLSSHRMVPYLVDNKNKVENFLYSKLSSVMIMSYDMLLRSYDAVSNINFDLMICDEGHRLKNGKSKLYELMYSLKIKKRIVLSGTPLQNDLQEFYYLNDFVNPGVFDSLKEFKKYFETPIVESRQPNCSASKKSLGESRSAQLNKRTSCYILRRTSEVNIKYLTTKNEYVIVCEATPLQQKLYQDAVEYWMEHNAAHLSVTHTLRKICNHPGLVQQNDESDESQDLTSYLSQQWSSLSNNEFSTDQSSKLMLVESLMEDSKLKKEKIVIVSYFTLTLDLIEVLCKEDDYSYLRLDGSTNVQNRKNIVEQFNDSKSSSFILLLSARAGGVGLNLIGASRLVLYDSDWNPASDLQAMARIWRHGQPKPVHIYRLLTAGTVEEKIFQRQISKVDLTNSVINGDAQVHDTGSKMSLEELKDLFTFVPNIDSTVHSSLHCKCSGTGDLPNIRSESPVQDDEDFKIKSDSENSVQDEDGGDGDDCFLECFKKIKPKDEKKKKTNNKEHLLMSWKHYNRDNLTPNFVENLGFPNNGQVISFLFIHTTQLEPEENNSEEHISKD